MELQVVHSLSFCSEFAGSQIQHWTKRFLTSRLRRRCQELSSCDYLEVLSESQLRVWQGLENYTGAQLESKIKSLSWQCVRSALADYWREKLGRVDANRPRLYYKDSSTLSTLEAKSEDTVSDIELLRPYLVAIVGTSEKHTQELRKTAVYLSRCHSRKEIAELLGISDRALYSRVMAISECLRSQGLEPSWLCTVAYRAVQTVLAS